MAGGAQSNTNSAQGELPFEGLTQHTGRSRRLSPKRPTFEKAGLADLFPYYAGFGFDWACSHLDEYAHGNNFVLDPWNGSGTTTLAAQSRGYPAIGVDLNPVANIAAMLRASKTEALAILGCPKVGSEAPAEADP